MLQLGAVGAVATDNEYCPGISSAKQRVGYPTRNKENGSRKAGFKVHRSFTEHR